MNEKKVYIFLADGFEEVEGLTVVDILRRAKADISMVSVTGKRTVKGSHGIEVTADAVFEEAELEDGAFYVLPGGMPGTTHLGEHKGLCSLLVRKYQEGAGIAAICAAPSVLGDLGILRGHTAVCYPGLEERLAGADVTKNEVEVSGNVVTSRGMGTAIPFALALTGQLCGEEKAQAIGKGIIFRAQDIEQ